MLLFNRLSKKQGFRRFLCWILIGGLAIPLALVRQLQAQTVATPSSSQERTTSTKIPNKEDLKRLADHMEKIFNALEAAAEEIPRDTFDPQAIIDKVGKDPIKLFEWVRDNTYLVPYRGVLRDHMGVLMDRLGNSLDRTLLLFVLLRLSGQDTLQLAHADLTDEQAAELLDKARPIPKGGALPSQQLDRTQLKEHLEKYARQYDLDAAELNKVVDQTTLQAQRLAEEAVQRTEEQSAAIMEMLRKKIEIPAREEQEATIHSTAIKALKHHWWLQWYNGQNWVDLDSSLPDAKAGQPFVPSSITVEGNKLNDKLGDESHKLQIRVIIERWEQGRLVEGPVLTQELFPAAFIGERIAIHHAPMNWPDDLNLFEERNPLKKLKATVLAQHEWIPVLSVGKARISKYSFSDTGEVNDPTLPGFVQSVLAGRSFAQGLADGVKALGNSIADILSTGRIENTGMSRREPAESNDNLQVNEPTSKAQLTAEWIEYEIRVPGEEPRTIRRQIFDHIGPAARSASKEKENMPVPRITEAQRLERGLALLGDTEILLQICQLSPEFFEDLSVKSLLANSKLLPGLIRDAGSVDLAIQADRASKLSRAPSQLYDLALARREWSQLRYEVYLDHLNIVNFHQYFREETSNELELCQAFDIVANDVAVYLKSVTDPFRVRLEQGVLDTNAEALLMAPRGKVENTAEMFAAGVVEGTEWVTIRDVQDPVLDEMELSRDIRTRVKEDLDAHNVVILPGKARAALGWWRVDSRTGRALGIGERGWGQTSIEWMQKILRITALGICLAAASQGYHSGSLLHLEASVMIVACLIGGSMVGLAGMSSWIGQLGSAIVLAAALYRLLAKYVAGYVES